MAAVGRKALDYYNRFNRNLYLSTILIKAVQLVGLCIDTDRTNQLHWLELLHTEYISLLNQAGKGRVRSIQ